MSGSKGEPLLLFRIQGGRIEMNAEEKEVIRGFLLDHWIADLREDRMPAILSEMGQLTQQELDETLNLARWMSAAIAPITPSASESDAVAAKVLAQIRSKRNQQQEVLSDVIKQAMSFVGLIQTSRGIRKLGVHELERALNLPSGTIEGLEHAKTPPHRIPSNSLVALLRALHIATGEVVTLIRTASVQWAQQAYGHPSTQLGRVDTRLGAAQRYLLLAEAAQHDNPQRELAEELQQIEQFCEVVAEQLR